VRVQETAKSYAKINLHLHIGAKREDGYHPLSSLFQLIELHDVITVALVEQNMTQIIITGMKGVPLTQNLMYKAAHLFLITIGAKAKISIDITKNIPLQGGLGGGSSNAATILLLLQKMYHYPLSNEQLYALGLSLGSDIPFFLYQQPVAYVEGRGEYITPIKPRNDLALILTIPNNFGVSTKQAFDDLDKTRDNNWQEVERYTFNALCHMYNNSVEKWRFYNDFKIIISSYNNLYNILHSSDNEDVTSFTAISGSGSALYTITDKGDESQIFDYFEEKYRTQVTNTLTRCIFLL